MPHFRFLRNAVLLLSIALLPVSVLADGSPINPDPLEPEEGLPDYEHGIDFEASSEPDEAPGMLGYALHGNGGLTVEYIYSGEVFNNMRGGISTRNATVYAGLFDLALTANLDELGFFPGGTFFMLGEDGHGRGLTEDYVGDHQVVSNMDPGQPFTQISEFWWEKSVFNGFLTVRIGKQDANAEFAVVDLAGDFVNSSFGFHPNIPMPSWPHPAMGVVTFFQLTDALSLNIGVFDGASDGRTWGFSGTGDIFSMYELRYQYELCGAPGEIHAGLWYHNGQFDDLAPVVEPGIWRLRKPRVIGISPLGPGDTYDGNHGFHMGVDQLLLKENSCCSDDQGLGGFLQYGWAPEDRNEVPNYFGAGLVYKGLIGGRDDDITGLGVAHCIFSDLLVDQNTETAIELFYKMQLTPYIVVQPDFQFIASPSGQYRDAFVGGMRFEFLL